MDGVKCPVCGNRGRARDARRFAPTEPPFDRVVRECQRYGTDLIPRHSLRRSLIVDDALWRSLLEGFQGGEPEDWRETVHRARAERRARFRPPA